MRLHQCRDNEPGRQLAWSRVSVLPSTPLGWKSVEKADCSDMIFPRQLQHRLRPLLLLLPRELGISTGICVGYHGAAVWDQPGFKLH